MRVTKPVNRGLFNLYIKLINFIDDKQKENKMSIKKELKEIRDVLKEELELLRKGKITNNRAITTSKVINQLHINIRLRSYATK